MLRVCGQLTAQLSFMRKLLPRIPAIARELGVAATNNRDQEGFGSFCS